MIASLRGRLIYTDNTSAVVECGGVGLRCTVTKNTLYKLPQKGEEVFLYTHLAVREDALDLYGFSDEDELNAFKLIISVNGVGAKIGIAMLSEFTASQLTVYIASGDAKALTAAAGVGIKLAQRIVLELKDKLAKAVATDDSTSAVTSGAANAVTGNIPKAIEALGVLGYSPSDVSPVLAALDSSLPVEQLIALTLKQMGRN